MSQNTHPKILRIGENQTWSSQGFYSDYPSLLKEDFKIRDFLEQNLPANSVEEIEIERERGKVKVIIKTSRPALIIGRGGEGVERIKKQIDKILERKNKKSKRELKIDIVTVKDVWASAPLASKWIASQLEKRMPFRRAIKMAMRKIMAAKEVKGARVQVTGRLNGIDIARKEWLQEGNLPRHKIRANIDYGFAQAKCGYGVIGVKVWIFKGENV